MAKPKPLRSILEDTLKSLRIDAPMKGYSLWGSWREIVGDAVAANAQPSAVRNRILFVEVSHPAWIQQLQFLKPTLLEKINGFLGESLIQDIRFRIGKISPPYASPKESEWREEGLDRESISRIEILLQHVEDDEVRETLREIMVKGAKLEQYRKKTNQG
jgi:hypothetical protein